jgi:hypothetical protein
MSIARTALEANAAPANTQFYTPLHQHAKQANWSLDQEAIAREFVEKYDLKPSQIGFAKDSTEPIFDFEALNLLALVLADIPALAVEAGDFNAVAGIATAICTITLKNDVERTMFGSCVINEELHDGSTVTDIGMALDVARSRALRTGLRAVGFDPVRAHRVAKDGLPASEFLDMRSKERKEIHALAEELGWIVGKNRATYQAKLFKYFKVSSSEQLDDLQRSQFLAMMRALRAEQKRAEAEAGLREEESVKA